MHTAGTNGQTNKQKKQTKNKTITKMKKRFLFTLATLVLLSQTALADIITRQEARQKAAEWVSKSGMSKTVKPSTTSAFKGKRKAAANENGSLYVFDFEDNKGFVIVSGDDRTESILGYTDSGSFDEGNLPVNMKAWLQSYVDQIEALPEDYQPTVSSEARGLPGGPRKVEKKAIPILVQTRWNQGYPYNMYCPYDGNSQCPTGCSVTAMAQCMYYVQWPIEPTTDVPGYNVLGQNLSDLPSTTIKWSKMKTNYSGQEGKNDESAKAIAELMQYCGWATRMGYSASGSGATVGSVRDALLKYFDYDASIKHIHRDNYSIAGWDDLIYSELASNRPVFYAGYAPGGHAFVCDGYDGNGLYHINWGWGGWDDGYFKLAILHPDDNSGIGASQTSGGYSMGQECLIGISKQMGTTPRNDAHMTINDTQINGTKIKSNYINWTGQTNSFHGAIVKQNEDGTFTPVTNINTADNLGANYLYNWEFNLSGKLTKGTHKLSPASKLKSSDEWIPLYNMDNQYILAECASSTSMTLTLHPIQRLGNITFDVEGSRTAGTEQKVVITIENLGDELFRDVCLYASTTSDKGEKEASKTQLVIPAGATEQVALFFTPPTDGTYTLWLTGGNKNDVIATGTALIGNKLKLTAKNGTAGYNNENYDRLFDGNTDTKWCYNFDGKQAYVTFTADRPVFVSGYRLATGGDTKTYPTRNPHSWVLYGSTLTTPPTLTSKNWEEISVIEEDEMMQPKNKTYYTFRNTQTTPTKGYRSFMLKVLGLNGAASGTCQISELDLITNEFYFRNTASGQWLQSNTRNTAYGTNRAELGTKGMDVELIPSAKTGYLINPKFGGNHSLNDGNLLMASDSAATVWTVAQANATERTYTIKCGTKYLGSDGTENNYLTSDATTENNKWQVFTREARIAQIAASDDVNNPTDVSWLLQGGDFSDGDERWGRWSFSSDGSFNKSNGDRNTKCNRAFEAWGYSSFANLSYRLKDIPNGLYKLVLNGLYTNTDTQAYAYLRSGDQEASHRLVKGTTSLNIDRVSQYFFTGRYLIDSDDMMVEVKDGTLSISVESKYNTTHSSNGWFVVDNFRLYYYGSPEEYETGIHGISTDESGNAGQNATSPAIYNLAGQRVGTPSKGIYIIGGNKVAFK